MAQRAERSSLATLARHELGARVCAQARERDELGTANAAVANHAHHASAQFVPFDVRRVRLDAGPRSRLRSRALRFSVRSQRAIFAVLVEQRERALKRKNRLTPKRKTLSDDAPNRPTMQTAQRRERFEGSARRDDAGGERIDGFEVKSSDSLG